MTPRATGTSGAPAAKAPSHAKKDAKKDAKAKAAAKATAKTATKAPSKASTKASAKGSPAEPPTTEPEAHATSRTPASAATVKERKGRVVLVATPIGNLGDLSPRATTALTEADVIACEDTRRTRTLLNHAGIQAHGLVSMHAHNEAAQTAALIERLQAGDAVAVVTDAGTPGISDPGERVVAAAIKAGFKVESTPGPSAVITALVMSGLPTKRFAFEGFLPRKGKERAVRLAAVARDDRTIVLYEAPHRLLETLQDLVASCGGDRPIVVARELTKMYEDVWRGTLAEAVAHTLDHRPRGEFVLVLAGAPAVEVGDADVERAVAQRLEAGDSTREAAGAVAEALGVPKRTAYDVALRLSKPPASPEP